MRLAAILFTLSLIASAQTKSAPADSTSTKLPVKRVVLYKNGVGYFEHVGKVRGTQDVNIDFTTSQLDDVLKSLTVVDYGEGRVTAVRYNSTAPLDQRLRGLRLPLGEQPTREQLLNALRGARVEVRSGAASAVGKILSVETRERKNARTDETIETTELALITDTGELRSFELNSATSVKIAEADLAHELNRYLAMVGSSRAKDVRRMTISASGTGDRDLLVSYISEVPLWKTTYRIVIPTDPKKQPLLQGWAVVDNTIGEDWKDVKLSLVAGAPQSFVQKLSTPYYSRRPVIGLPETAQLAPQTHEGTIQNIVDLTPGIVAGGASGGIGAGAYRIQAAPPPPPPSAGPLPLRGYGGSLCSVSGNITDPTGAPIANANVSLTSLADGSNRTAYSDAAGNYCITAAAPGKWRFVAESSGFRSYARTTALRASGNRIDAQLQVASAAETVEVADEPESPASLNAALEEQFESASGREIGELFSYDIKQPITIGKDQSALVPIVQARVDAMKVTLWNGSNQVPRNALWLRNTSGATLDSGSFSIVEGDSFAGEGLFDPIKPNERRLLSYAGESAIRVESENESDEQPISHVRIVRGLMTVTRQGRSKQVYTIHNADKEARNVVIEHPAREGWKFVGDLKPEETSESHHRFLVKVEPGATSKLEVAEYHPISQAVLLSNLTSDDILMYSRQRVLSSELEKSFRDVLAQKNQITGIDQQLRLREQEINNISADQNRVRENMKALKGSSEEKALVQRYATQMNQQEDQLARLRSEMNGLRTQREQANAQLNKMLQDISFDQEFEGK